MDSEVSAVVTLSWVLPLSEWWMCLELRYVGTLEGAKRRR